MVRGLMVAKRKHQSSGLHFAEMDIRKKKNCSLAFQDSKKCNTKSIDG
jgi:hypothetical protein